MKICFLSYSFPGKHNTSEYAFVKQLVDAVAAQGNDCYVIAPFNKSRYRLITGIKEEYQSGDGKVIVYRPPYYSLSNLHVGNFYITKWLHHRAVKKAFGLLTDKPDVVYGHFWSSAFEGFEYAKTNRLPLFVATGESKIESYCTKKTAEFYNYVKGVICVSGKNRDESVGHGLTTTEKCIVLPNAVNQSLFFKQDKVLCRKKIGLPTRAFIVAFVGWFNERKGSARVAAAIKKIHENDVFSLFIGEGEQNPDCDNILFKGLLPHDNVPLYLNAADAFVLPTLHEGCCNAIVEAMACGLPVVSSNLPFNWDVLDESNSIMVDPNNVEEISSAIMILRDNAELLSKLSEGALRKATGLTIEKRAERIIDFINLKK